MTVSNGRELLVIPGPTTIPDEVLRAMHRPAVDIFDPELVQITDTCTADLKTVFGTSGEIYIYSANGHGAWEAALANVLSSGDEILVLNSGRFAEAWGKMADMMNLGVQVLPQDWRHAVESGDVETYLRDDREGRIKAVLVVQVDTASGVVNDIQAIVAAVRAAGHDALVMVDTIASLATMPFRMDDWGVDIAVGGSQKGLMLPPGLSFVAAGERAWAAHPTAGLRTRYWDWSARHGELHPEKYCGTPPEHLLYGLRCSLDMLLREGLDNVIERHRLLANAVRTAVTTWSEGGALEFNILEPRQRADSVTTVLMDEAYDPVGFRDFCKARCGVIVGGGIGDLRGKALRIAHMGHINAPHILGALGVVELGLIARNVPHGAGGVQKAIEFLGENLKA
tara:strand:+ start:185 stop:1372 length:1188 start_codon:yes stop_codon:yes gene_type:complete